MEHQPLYTYYEGYPIYLYTTTLSHQRHLGFKKPIDVFSHWAVYINNQCYELKKDNDQAKKRKDRKYFIRSLPAHEWLQMKHDKEHNRPYEKVGPIGYTARPWSIETINHIANRVWEKPLQSKYVYDENNCQVFIRLLVDLIGNKQTQAEFPGFFDQYVKRAGTTRDSVFLLGTAAAATVAATVTFMAAPVDPTGTAAAGFALSAGMVLRSSTALWSDRIIKDKYIKEAQEELREELRRNGILPH
ncbi:uncharacterized protein F4807DRAFT_269963 [Annulohypoxylon truncatum]|uniref:uncharacterized protein n=1 Tax=Annulohypoxylon truncatum TaxID=327061 RepID=UPI002008484B|nr:uncharacterized protein F4807DRAFT_269963 [Annulohypoxylon truncatum]KAI1213538.1 hypothetical protein F4807DRAFT_269963 [Annulohypoxylon truncatum]